MSDERLYVNSSSSLNKSLSSFTWFVLTVRCGRMNASFFGSRITPVCLNQSIPNKMSTALRLVMLNDRFAGIDSNTISIGSVDFTWTISPFDVSMDSF